jgi:hypothetical protein
MQTGPGEEEYVGSTRYGVTTQAYQSWGASFYVSPYEPPPDPEPVVAPVSPKKEPPAIPSIAWTSTLAGFGPNGAKYTRTCPRNGRVSVVVGDSIYSSKSSICSAAVHVGAISAAQGGTIVFQIKVGLLEYRGVSRNGLKSLDGEGTLLGFAILSKLKKR